MESAIRGVKPEWSNVCLAGFLQRWLRAKKTKKGKTLKNMGSKVCQICGDNVGLTVDGEPFVACDVCAFPIYRPCYEYERKDGNQSCPQCKTEYKRHKGTWLNVSISCGLFFRFFWLPKFGYRGLGFYREKLIHMALLVGSDYLIIR